MDCLPWEDLNSQVRTSFLTWLLRSSPSPSLCSFSLLVSESRSESSKETRVVGARAATLMAEVKVKVQFASLCNSWVGQRGNYRPPLLKQLANHIKYAVPSSAYILNKLVQRCSHLLLFLSQFVAGWLTFSKLFHETSCSKCFFNAWVLQWRIDHQLQSVASTADWGPPMLLHKYFCYGHNIIIIIIIIGCCSLYRL